MTLPISPERLAERFRHVRRWRESGLSQEEYAQEHRISVHSLRWWSRLERVGVARPKAIEPRACHNPECCKTFTPRMHHGRYCRPSCMHRAKYLAKLERKAVVSAAA